MKISSVCRFMSEDCLQSCHSGPRKRCSHPAAAHRGNLTLAPKRSAPLTAFAEPFADPVPPGTGFFRTAAVLQAGGRQRDHPIATITPGDGRAPFRCNHDDMIGHDAIADLAERILAEQPDPIVRFRLLRDVLRKPLDSTEVMQARGELLKSCWVEQLERQQSSDGSWGRLHSRDTTAKQKIPTTEAGVERALTLGLDSGHPVLGRASGYLMGILEGARKPSDPPEKNDRWSTGVRLFSAATLAQIQPDLPILDDVWDVWMTIAHRVFASGEYNPEAEICAHCELTGATVRGSYLRLGNKYQLALLACRAAALPKGLEEALLNWVWNKEDGIGYLGQPLFRLPRLLERGVLDDWFRSLELLSHFPSWRRMANDAVNWLWHQRNEASLWDFGPRSRRSVFLPLSESWRSRTARQQDWTTRVLILLSR